MKQLAFAAFLAASFALVVMPADARAPRSSSGSHSTRGYYRDNGRQYVAPHRSTNPNSTRNDNYSTRGNVNPFTGKAGTRRRDGE